MKTLYLMESQAIEIRRDGPSLWVTRSGRAGQRVPLRWVERVVITGNVRLDAEVITLFTANRIPVLFLNRAGKVLGLALTPDRLPGSKEAHFNRRFRQSLYNIEWRERYRNWLAHVRSEMQRNVLRHLRSQVVDRLLAQGWRDDIFQAAASQAVPDWARSEFYPAVLKFFEGLFHDFLLNRLQQCGLDPATVTLDPLQRFGLVADFLRACRPELVGMGIGFVRSVPERKRAMYWDGSKREWTTGGLRKLVGYFERDTGHLNQVVERLARELQDLLWEEINEGTLSRRL